MIVDSSPENRFSDLQMIDLPPSPRYERKFVADRHRLPEILGLVRRHPAVFREIFPARIVNNIYLDSPDLRDYRQHVNGAANRSKTRVRWYGELRPLMEKPSLERKLKRGLVSGKTAWRLSELSMNGDGVHLWVKESFEDAELPEMLRSALRHLEPSLFNQYRRHYFLSGDNRFRITVDSDLRFGSLRKRNSPALGTMAIRRSVVIELKYGIADAEQAARVTNALPFRLTRCSKYVLGIEATH